MAKNYFIYSEALRKADKELQEEKTKHLAEIVSSHDRRYTEGNELRAMALKIKETADRDALELDRASQAYKAERYDVRSEQSLKETGIYATRDDLAMVVTRMEKALKPLVDFVSSQQGASKGSRDMWGWVSAGIILAIAVISFIMRW